MSAVVTLQDVSHPFYPPSLGQGGPSFIDFRPTFAEAMDAQANKTKASAIQVLNQIASSSDRKALLILMAAIHNVIACPHVE